MGIPHFQALSDKRKTIFLDNPQDFTYQEKVDGSNFLFGATDGRIWAGRKTEAQKFYSVDDWPDMIWAQNFRMAHQALLTHEDRLRHHFGDNFIAHSELLNPLYPNTIDYNKGSLGCIVVYGGDVSLSFESFLTSFAGPRSTSTDGITIIKDSVAVTMWVTPLPTYVPPADYTEPLRRIPLDRVHEVLIREFTQCDSQFGQTRPEGMVFKHKDGWMFKVVDKEYFTALNTRNFAFRKLLFKTPGQKTDSIMDEYTRNIRNGMSQDVASAMALERLDVLWAWYTLGGMPNQPPKVHERNLEAMASLFQQLKKETTWADAPFQM